MSMNFLLLLTLLFLPAAHGSILEATLTETRCHVPLVARNGPLISPRIHKYTRRLLTKWNSSGLSLAVVRKDDSLPSGWRHEFGSYGIAKGDGSLVTPDSVFAIASNSKLFLSLSVGLLITNETLAKERGQGLSWTTKIRDLLPEWALLDEVASRESTLQDLLSHRTGVPAHHFSGIQRPGGVPEVVSTLRHLRPAAEFRETFQYSDLMYEALSYLPQALLNQTYESYVEQHLFAPLNMTATTFSVAEAEKRGTLADGFQWDMRDLTKGENGTLRATVPYFQRPGEERTWAGPAGILSSARDLAVWVSMLLNKGRHPYTNKVIVSEEIIDYVAAGRTVTHPAPDFPEVSVRVYGAGQWRFSYQGHDLIQHGGDNPGFKTQVARFPNDNLGVIVLSNDANGAFLMEANEYRLADEILGLTQIDWDERMEAYYNYSASLQQQVTPRPSSPIPPTNSFTSLAEKSFSHGTYGTLQPCVVPETLSFSQLTGHRSHEDCAALLTSHTVKRILSASNLSIPTYIIPWKRSFSTHLRLAHFDANTFNVTILWSNAEVREKEGYSNEKGGDVLLGLDKHFEVEWVGGSEGEEEGLAFKGGFWTSEGPEPRTLSGTGKENAEVWFAKD
ncbi:unnamed protein product [Cyclocybe aegerita]|uniref:Beta-lactamase-related domain-containing protein n=1 Tax=Cyclocybe aegerita TaxID=1973307 RepID=A0A8S0W153_CYCAE|nr:unnamed protein product [Cyclocybe aegerita]